MVRIVGIILAVCSMLAVQVTTVDFQHVATSEEIRPKSNRVVSQETYDRVLDIVFPRDGPRGDYGLVLRFKPSSHPESQVVIKRGVDKVEVVEYTSLSGNIYSKLNELKSSGDASENVVEMAKLIKVRRRYIELPSAQVKRWHAGFLGSLGESLKAFKKRSEEFDKSGSITLTIDGTFYDLWYGQGVNDMSLSFYDEEVGDQQPNGQLKLVQWMNSIRREVENQKAVSQ